MPRKDPFANEPDPLTIIDPDSLNVDELAKYSLTKPWGQWRQFGISTVTVGIASLAILATPTNISPVLAGLFLALPFLYTKQSGLEHTITQGGKLLASLTGILTAGYALRQGHLFLVQLGLLPPLSPERLFTILMAIPYYIAILWMTYFAVRFSLQAKGIPLSNINHGLKENRGKVFWSLMLVFSPAIAGTLLVSYARLVFYGLGLSVEIQQGLAMAIALPLAGYTACCLAPYMDNLAEQLTHLQKRNEAKHQNAQTDIDQLD